jgi:uncharacterized damage-inducible protein DinB
MLSTEQRREGIARIAELPRLVEEAVRGLDDSQLDTPYRDGGWTVRQVVHHLADSHMNAYIRSKLTLTEEHPPLKPYDQDEWAKLRDTTASPLAPSLAILRGLHERWVALFESVPEEGWSRTAYHPERGDITLDDQLALYARHGAHHVGQITGLRARNGW